MADAKKQVPLRLSPKLYDAIAAWATECVRQRKKNGKYAPEELDVPPELDIS